MTLTPGLHAVRAPRHLPWIAVLCGLAAAGCEPSSSPSSSSSPAEADAGFLLPVVVANGNGARPIADSIERPAAPPVVPQRDAVFDLSIADLGTVALELRRRALGATRAALVGLNTDYVAGELSEAAYECAGEDYPVTGYYCGGENGGGEVLEDWGTPIVAFTFLGDEICRDALLTGADAGACAVEFSELRYPSGHVVRYRVRFVNGAPRETLDVLADGAEGAEFAIDPELGETLCKVTIDSGTTISYSDEAFCDETVRAVLAP